MYNLGLKVMRRSYASVLLIGIAVIIALIALMLGPVPQPVWYGNFADHRSWMGIPNFGDVSSNLPFAVIGLWGLIVLLNRRAKFLDPLERWPYLLVFFGLLLTSMGSCYYHLAPNNARLVWDRIPIMIVFMALLAAVIAERVSVRGGLLLLPVLESVGVASVLVWYAGESHGHSDLRFYAGVQVYAVLVLLLVLLFPTRYSRGSDFAVVVGFYVLAKIFETCDQQIFSIGHFLSGHTLKHLASAAAGYWILRMLQKRELLFIRDDRHSPAMATG